MGEGVAVRSRPGRDEPFTLPPSPARGRVRCACFETRPESGRRSQWEWVATCVHAPAVTSRSPFPITSERQSAVRRRSPPVLADRLRSMDEMRIRQPAAKGSRTRSEPAFAFRNRGAIQLESPRREARGLHPISPVAARGTQRRLQLLYLHYDSLTPTPTGNASI